MDPEALTPAQADLQPPTRAERDVLEERAPQRRRWGDRHDDRDRDEQELARAGAFLVHPGPNRQEPGWANELWTKLGRQHTSVPSKRRARLVVGAALIIAEIDRMDREAERAARPVAPPSDEQELQDREARRREREARAWREESTREALTFVGELGRATLHGPLPEPTVRRLFEAASALAVRVVELERLR
jgi:hypothetical protein